MKSTAKIYLLFLRYLILVPLAIPNLWIFYSIFTPLTIYPVYFFLKLFINVSLSGNILFFDSIPSVELVKACIAGSAYFLLLVLNFTTPMNYKKRAKALLFSFSVFLLVNILRIIIFSFLLIESFSLFNLTHLIFWYFLSIVIVFAIWFLTIRLFKIKEIPVYSDLIFLYKNMKKKKLNKLDKANNPKARK